LAAACGATPVVVEAPAQIPGPAYHAAAALVANGTAGLAYAGVETLLRLGVERREAEAALGALLRTVAGHIERLGLPAALTGPVVRGDADTVAAHRAALARSAPEALPAYDAIVPTILRCAREAGLGDAQCEAIEAALRAPVRGG
ncbi:MAG: DUF2520 domain-containing protein, partial [Myxococcales bacterium]|nr:DUF2520 domain-containing protein [Myxococcales bacterium]